MKNPIADQTYVSDLTEDSYIDSFTYSFGDKLKPRVTRSGGLNELYAFCEDCYREGKLQLACRHELKFFQLTKSYRHPKATGVDWMGGDTDDNYHQIHFGFRVVRSKQ